METIKNISFIHAPLKQNTAMLPKPAVLLLSRTCKPLGGVLGGDCCGKPTHDVPGTTREATAAVLQFKLVSFPWISWGCASFAHFVLDRESHACERQVLHS